MIKGDYWKEFRDMCIDDMLEKHKLNLPYQDDETLTNDQVCLTLYQFYLESRIFVDQIRKEVYALSIESYPTLHTQLDWYCRTLDQKFKKMDILYDYYIEDGYDTTTVYQQGLSTYDFVKKTVVQILKIYDDLRSQKRGSRPSFYDTVFGKFVEQVRNQEVCDE